MGDIVNGPGVVYSRQPGTYINKTESSDSESNLPVKQANIMAGALWLMELPIAMLFIASVVALRMYAVLVYGELCIVLVAVIIILARWRIAVLSHDDSYEVGDIVVGMLVVMFAYLLTWTHLIDWLDWWWKGAIAASFTIVYLSIPLIISRLALVWRMGAEIFDSEGASMPRRASDYPKQIWPWTNIDDISSWSRIEPADDYIDADMMRDAIKAEIKSLPVKEVPRPVPVYNTASPNPSGSNVQNRLDLLTDSAHKVPIMSVESFVSPTGITCTWADMVEFIWDGLQVGVATMTWNKRKHWGKPYIQALQKTLQQHNLAESNGEGSPYKMVITTKAQAAVAIQELYDGLFKDTNRPSV